MTAVKAAIVGLLCEASAQPINVPIQLWILRRNVKCCNDFERFWRRSVKSQALQESFSTNYLMQRSGYNKEHGEDFRELHRRRAERGTYAANRREKESFVQLVARIGREKFDATNSVSVPSSEAPQIHS